MAKRLHDELPKQKTFFDQEGFLILRKFFDEKVIDQALKAIDRVRHDRSLDVVVDNLENGERIVLGLMSLEQLKESRTKINDLYLTLPDVRSLALNAVMVNTLKNLLCHTPALCNSLYFEKGSAQPLHVDSLYMTPQTPGHLIAIWVAMEDTDVNAGPLEFYPKSHLITPMRFSDGKYSSIPAEMSAWEKHMEYAIQKAGLKKQTFSAQKGDVFIWHSNLLHGGGAIYNTRLTRKSCVFHYFSEHDANLLGYTLVREAGAFWIDRAPQPLPYAIATQLAFSEKFYLARYSDVSDAVKNGVFANGKDHYERYGKREGRLPR